MSLDLTILYYTALKTKICSVEELVTWRPPAEPVVNEPLLKEVNIVIPPPVVKDMRPGVF